MWKRVALTLQDQVRNPVFPWVLAFVVGCLAIPQHGDQLELPRMLTLRAMADDHSFQIGKYIDWTDEWARTPDGRYYNNRAPGPVLIGFPLFFVVDRVFVQWREHGKVDAQGRRPWPGYIPRATLSFWLQELPFSLLVLFIASWLLGQGVSLLAVHFFALAALFGNTADLFMNNWSGHGLTAVAILAAAFALLRKQYFWLGFAYGMGLLSDYCEATLLLPLLAALFYQERDLRKWILPFMLGGVLPGILWVWYHVSAFGSPFLLANHFQNPMYQDVKSSGNIIGIFRPWPDFPIMGELLFGSRRGILFTQPWVLVFAAIVVPLLVWREKSRTQVTLFIFAFFGLFFLLWMNSMYGGWHAGNTSGPRYLSAIFSVWALLVAIFWNRTPQIARAFLALALFITLVYRGLVFAVNPVAPVVPLWGYHWAQIVEKETLTNWFRLGLYWALLLAAAAYIFVRSDFRTRSQDAIPKQENI